MMQLSKSLDASKLAAIRNLDEQLRNWQSKKDMTDKRALAQQELLQNELDGYIAADCPLCGFLMIKSLAVPLITDNDETESKSWLI
jgi:hypothetical protein